MVLPCAEERDLALKTVKSVFESTPPDVLHEIVVVDDGSNPPLSTTHLQADVQRQYKAVSGVEISFCYRQSNKSRLAVNQLSDAAHTQHSMSVFLFVR